MARHLLDEIRDTALDDAGRERLQAAHERSVTELATALSPELHDELRSLTSPLAPGAVTSDAELRIVQAQLVGWLEGLFHGVRATVAAQQLAARQQLEHMRSAQAADRGEPERRGTYL